MLIGTSTKIVNGQPKNATKNFSIGDLTGFIKQNVSLNDVLLVGNASLLDAKIGKLYLYDTPVTNYGNIALNQNRFSFNTVTYGEVFRMQTNMFSSLSSSGYRGSFEVSNITANRVWDFPNKSGTVALLSDVPVVSTPTLQEVTDEGSSTTNTIQVAGITSGNFASDGYTVTISDSNDGIPNFYYIPYAGLQIGNGIDIHTFIYQDASIGFQNAAGFGNLRSDLLTGNWSWQLPNASGTLALTSNIPTVGTWGALNYPAWTTGTPFVKMTAAGTFALDTNTYLTTTAAALTYYPIPTGTISQYIRGDGSLATFPSTAIPTLQQVTTAGNVTTNTMVIGGGGSPGDTTMFLGTSVQINVLNSTGGYSNVAWLSPIAGLLLKTNSNPGFFSSILKSDLITGTDKTFQFPNNSGTLALLSDIPSGGVTSVGLTMPSAFTVSNSPITSSGDIAVTGAGTVNQYVRGDGTLANFPNSTGGGSSVNYYLNGSVSQGTFGGTTYYQMSKTPILGAGTNFTRTNGQGDGYIASFITDAGDPSQLNIPGGNWNVEFYFNASSGGGSPSFYAELYKVSDTGVFTLIASDSLNPEGITNGTTVDQYFTSIPVPQTTLLVTDRLAVRIFVNTGGRTITLHTENGNLSEILTTFTTGLTALNGLTQQVQNLAVGTSGTDFAISSVTDTHTFNLPTASATNRGALSSTDWSTFNGKQSGKSINTVSTNTSAGSAASTDYVYLASGTINVTLPTAVGNQNLYTIKNVGTGVITINTTSSETIDGSLTAPIRVQYLSLTLVSDGANWNII